MKYPLDFGHIAGIRFGLARILELIVEMIESQFYTMEYCLNRFAIKIAFFLTLILYSDFKAKYVRMYKNATAYYIYNK